MGESQASVVIRRPLEDVWAVLTDAEKTPAWSASAVEEHWLTPPPHGVGSRRRAVTTGFGRRSTNDAEVTAYEPNRSWTMTSISGPRFVASAVFEAVDGGTRVDWTWLFDLQGPLRLVQPIVVRAFAGQFAKDLARLKELMESGRL